MASLSFSFMVLSLAILLQFLLVFASTKSIDAICKTVDDKTFCVKTLSTYPPAASATNTFQAATAALKLGKSYAEKCAAFTAKAATENPNLKKQFDACQDAFKSIVSNLWSASGELKESPDTANYDVMICMDSTTIVKNMVGKNKDATSKTIMNMKLRMDKLISIEVGATIALGG
ncbi:unnamed protein product [Cochlearia groenlandica]